MSLSLYNFKLLKEGSCSFILLFETGQLLLDFLFKIRILEYIVYQFLEVGPDTSIYDVAISILVLVIEVLSLSSSSIFTHIEQHCRDSFDNVEMLIRQITL